MKLISLRKIAVNALIFSMAALSLAACGVSSEGVNDYWYDQRYESAE